MLPDFMLTEFYSHPLNSECCPLANLGARSVRRHFTVSSI